MDKPEWKFEELPEEVDIDRIKSELSERVVIEVQVYLEQFKINAPKTYELFKNKYPNIGCIKVL